jgi:hypothetical protein
MTTEKQASLSPTQDLIMSNLAARHRLGHTMWPFSTSFGKQIKQLEALGLVGSKSGIVERTIEIWLTSRGKAAYLSSTYVPPILAEQSTKAEARTLRAHALWSRDKGDRATDPIQQSHYYHAAVIANERADRIEKKG